MRLLLLLFLFLSPSVHANEKADDVLNYIPATYQNIAFSLWALNAYDPSDEAAIDAYLQISKCPIFKMYKDDDFMWQNIREGEKREIDYFADQYPNRFYIDSLIALGRYDFQNNQFELLDNFKFSDAGTIRFPFYKPNTRLCVNDEAYAKYFSTLMSFKSDTEYALTHVPIAPDRANKLIDEISRYTYPTMRNYERVVPIRFEITITGHEFAGKEDIIFTGDMDRIQVFSDAERQNPIWTKQFKLFD